MYEYDEKFVAQLYFGVWGLILIFVFIFGVITGVFFWR